MLRPFLALAAVALAVLAAPAGATPSADAAGALANPPLPDLPVGKADAPVTIIEYASMTCSHCAAFHKDVWPALKAKYIDTGKAKLVLREFPLDGLATAAFMLARCAGPEKRNALTDQLFDHQADWAFVANPVFKLKEQWLAAGLTEDAFQACLKDQTMLDKVNSERDAAAKALEVNSTPTFFVNGQKMTGEHSLAKFDEVLAPLTH